MGGVVRKFRIITETRSRFVYEVEARSLDAAVKKVYEQKVKPVGESFDEQEEIVHEEEI